MSDVWRAYFLNLPVAPLNPCFSFCVLRYPSPPKESLICPAIMHFSFDKTSKTLSWRGSILVLEHLARDIPPCFGFCSLLYQLAPKQNSYLPCPKVAISSHRAYKTFSLAWRYSCLAALLHPSLCRWTSMPPLQIVVQFKL